MKNSVTALAQVLRKHLDNTKMPTVSVDQILQCICQMKNRKAGDLFGVTNEHLKFADQNIALLIKCIVERIFNSCEMPSTLKTGIITPIFKNKQITQGS